MGTIRMEPDRGKPELPRGQLRLGGASEWTRTTWGRGAAGASAVTADGNVCAALAVSQVVSELSGFRRWQSFSIARRFCGSGIQTAHRRHLLSLLHAV